MNKKLFFVLFILCVPLVSASWFEPDYYFVYHNNYTNISNGGGSSNLTGVGSANFLSYWTNSTNLNYSRFSLTNINTTTELANLFYSVTNPNGYISSYVETDPIWTAEKSNYALLTTANITGSGSAGNISYWTNSTNLASSIVYINGSNVGIGKTNPGAKLDIVGNINFVGDITSSGNSNLHISNGIFAQGWSGSDTATIGPYNAFGLRADGKLIWATSGPANGRGDTGLSRLGVGIVAVGNGTQGDYTGTLIAGNVGIGTTTPNQKLEVNGSINATNYYGNGATLTGVGNVSGTMTTNYIQKATSGSLLGNSLIYDNGINIGIGTTNTNSTLTLIGNYSADADTIKQRTMTDINIDNYIGLEGAGTSIRSGKGGDVNLSNYKFYKIGGTGGSFNLLANKGGDVYLLPNSSTSQGGNGGSFIQTAGKGGLVYSTNYSMNHIGGTGGSYTLTAGDGASLLDYTIYPVNVSGGTGGNFVIYSGLGGRGSNNSISGNGGDIGLLGNAGGDAGNNGIGHNVTAGNGGGVYILSGDAGSVGLKGTGGSGGPIYITAGSASGTLVGAFRNSGSGGSIVLSAGSNTAPATNITGQAGSIFLYPGTSTNTSKLGYIYMLADNGGSTRSTSAVGIGIDSSINPTATLHQDLGIAKATYHKFTARTTTGQTATDGFDIGISATGEAQLRQYENMNLTIYTNNAERVRVNNIGNVGINMTAPAYTLDVAGTLQANDYYSADNTKGYTGTCTILGLTNITVKNGLITGCN